MSTQPPASTPQSAALAGSAGSDIAAASAAAPAVLRHEGPLRVSVPEGGSSALSPGAVVGTGRLRPAVGPVPPALAAAASAVGALVPGRRLRSPLAPTPGHQVERDALPRRPRFVFTPDIQGPDPDEQARQNAEFERRMDRLAQGNLQVSRQVSILESEMQGASARPGKTEPKT